MTARVLVAGIGNIFLGDDAFGVAVVRELIDPPPGHGSPPGPQLDAPDESPGSWSGPGAVRPFWPHPKMVKVVDYGIRAVHFAYDVLDGKYNVVILVDALPMGEPPGTLAVTEVDLSDEQWTIGTAGTTPDAHGMDPASSLRLVTSLGGWIDRVLVVGCQPATLAEGMRMSPAVAAAIQPAVRMVTEVVTGELERMGVVSGA